MRLHGGKGVMVLGRRGKGVREEWLRDEGTREEEKKGGKRTRVCVCVCARTHTHTDTHAHTQAHTHTHTYTRRSAWHLTWDAPALATRPDAVSFLVFLYGIRNEISLFA